MASNPITPTSFRLSGDVRALLALAAKRERRTLTSMLEVIVVQWCKDNDIEQQSEPEQGSEHRIRTTQKHSGG